MSRNDIIRAALILVILTFISTSPSYSEEGMWTLDNLPLRYMKDTYGFSPSPQWLEQVQMASVRFNDGGSGSFVSSRGLVLTNHHVAVVQLQKMSSEGHDYVRDGYYARSMAEEIKCTDTELNVLISMENVTDRINAAIKGLTGEKAVKARKSEMARLEKEKMKKTGLRTDTVTLYHGGEYWLYSYKKYRDVRLVMAPEKQIAFFGGDPDNFTYPRYDLDFALFRAYENNKPVTPDHYFKVNPKGPSEGELVFVSGHPGDTKRLLTVSQYIFNRDHTYPDVIAQLKGALNALDAYSKTGVEEKRRAATMVFYFENSCKCLAAELQGLKDPRIFSHLEAGEAELKMRVGQDPGLAAKVGPAWRAIEHAYQKYEKEFNRITYRNLKGNRLPQLALNSMFFIEETRKPDGERLKGYHDSEIDTWKYENLSPAPIYKDLEEAMMAYYLELSRQKCGNDDEFVKLLLDGKSPRDRAHELISGTKLDDPVWRKRLIEGGEGALRKSDDPLIRLALKLEPYLRQNIRWKEEQIESVVTPASEEINRARFKIYGKTTYPDATFTLRLAYGTVKGYPMNGTVAPPITTFYGLYDRHYSFAGRTDWDLPQRYLDRLSSLTLATPLNFVADADIVGGNSGSPVINRNAELVGLIFDGNIESCAGRFVFWGEANRAVAVHSSALLEALKRLYDAGTLADEMLSGSGR